MLQCVDISENNRIRLISWNLRAGAGRRVIAIQNQLKRWKPDILGFCEFRGTAPSQQLALWLNHQGYCHQISTVNTDFPARNAMLLASRFPLRHIRVAKMPEIPERWALIEVDSPRPLRIGLMHVPNYTTPHLKYPYLDALLEMVDKSNFQSTILMGDMNCGKRGLDEEKIQPPRFYREHDCLVGLEESGWIDCFRYLHGNRRQYSWYSHRNNGFRLDYAFCSGDLAPELKSVSYRWGRSPENQSRRDALSDHAALIIDLKKINGDGKL
ncbi:MAG: endonuclease/exonuclease/phosphatase family protein [Pseudomonadota bacterium]